MSLQSQLARLLVAALALVVALTLAAPPALAAPPQQPLAKSAAVKAAALPGSALAQAAPAAKTTSSDAPAPKPFLKTTRGAIAIALFAGATGFTIYSFSHDRVSSPAR